jgi:hypothetical protein
MSKEKTGTKFLISDLACIIIGLLFVFETLAFHIDIAEVALIVATIGFALIFYGVFNTLAVFHTWEKLRKLHQKRMQHANAGVIWIWAVCFISICIYSIAWFTLGWATFGIIDSVQASYDFPSQANQTITLIRTVIAWHPIFFILGMLLWAFVNSQRREDVTYPTY